MEYLNALLLNVFEMTFVFISLLMLLQQRKAIGLAPFYLVFGFLLFLADILVSAELQGTLFGDVRFRIGTVVIYMPIIASYLAVYITCGTLRTQHLIIGAAALGGLIWYLAEITGLQCRWLGFSISNGFSGSTLEMLVDGTKRSSTYSALGVFADLFIVPIFYTLLIKCRVPRYFALAGSMMGTVFSQLPELIIYWYTGFIDKLLFGNLLGRLFAAFFLCFILYIYLKWLEKETSGNNGSSLDLLFAFVGSYGKAKELEVTLHESEKRYKMVFENAGELIFTLDHTGKVIDANIAALNFLELESSKIAGFDLFSFLEPLEKDEQPLAGSTQSTRRIRCGCQVNGKRRLLDISLSPVLARSKQLFFLIARDITEEQKLADEKAELAEQLIHSQRLEALGRLAGGVAHDFNNCIHSMLGHIDMILYTSKLPEDATGRLEKVAGLAEQAGKLTSQLLGFARKGKYQVEMIDVKTLVEDSVSMLGPQSIADVDVLVEAKDPGLIVSGDRVQLHQVLLNLMLNAIDAMGQTPSGNKRLIVSAGNASEAPVVCTAPVKISDFDPSRYAYVSVADTGCGIPPEAMSKLFEPFYTTKPVGKGTGMGLAMVYGTITHHQGWVQIESEPGEGTVFCCFLPLESIQKSGEKEVNV
jgi:PAS domain S-box-containing protein